MDGQTQGKPDQMELCMVQEEPEQLLLLPGVSLNPDLRHNQCLKVIIPIDQQEMEIS
jgi:hypothetical protein